MAKKTLNEAVVRRFQKLANVGTINEMYGMKEEEEELNEQEEEAEMAPTEDPMPAEDPMGAEDEGGMDVEITNEEADILIQLGEKLSGAMGGEAEEMADVEMADAEEDEEEAIMEALRGISYAPSKSEVVNEVAKRVAKRLQTAKLHEAKLNRALGRK
jgi:hypothetical protein